MIVILESEFSHIAKTFLYFSWDVMINPDTIMAHAHCMGPGPGQGLGLEPGMMTGTGTGTGRVFPK